MSRAIDFDNLSFTFFVSYDIDANEVASWIDQSYKVRDEQPPEKYSAKELYSWALDYIIEESKAGEELDRIYFLTNEGIKNIAYLDDKDE